MLLYIFSKNKYNLGTIIYDIRSLSMTKNDIIALSWAGTHLTNP